MPRSTPGALRASDKAGPFFIDQSKVNTLIPVKDRTSPQPRVARKVPSALEIFANRNSYNDLSNFDPAPSNSPPFQRMKTALWESCDTGVLNALICGRIEAANALLRANYQNYMNVFNRRKTDTTWSQTWGCTIDALFPSSTDTGAVIEAFLLQKLYGWTPFGAESGCNGKANQFADTPG